jgi:hypothetical protein
MSERDDVRWLSAIIIAVLLMTYLEADSWFWRSQIRDLQRRVGQLESERR